MLKFSKEGNDTCKSNKQIMEKENNKMIRKKIFGNVIIAIAIMLYFMLINFSYFRVEEEIFVKGIKITSMIVLFLGIGILEIAYSKDSGKIAINGIEILILSVYTLTIWHVLSKIGITFETYIVISSYVFAIYYILKAILIYTNEKRIYLKSLSDIHEIVSNEPIKKEAKRREKKENA